MSHSVCVHGLKPTCISRRSITEGKERGMLPIATFTNIIVQAEVSSEVGTKASLAATLQELSVLKYVILKYTIHV